jgi:predicted GNAT family N-acyltransferase
MLKEQALNPQLHDRQAFECGVAELNDYLKRFAVQQSKKGIAAVQVLVDTDRPELILGYYSLSAAQIDVTALDAQLQRKLPKYPVPCFRLGRLAVHIDYRALGYGQCLIGLAVNRCLEAKQYVGAYALVVDAKDISTKAFYEHYGFMALSDNPFILYLPLGAAKKLDPV